MRMALVALILLAASAQAEVFRWQDSAGKVHYGETPPAGARDVRRITVPKATGAAAAKPTQKSAPLAGKPKPRKAKRAESMTASSEFLSHRRAQRCERSRTAYAALSSSKFLYGARRNGLRTVLSAEARARAVTRARQAIVRWCR